jgi:hypothetical protein
MRVLKTKKVVKSVRSINKARTAARSNKEQHARISRAYNGYALFRAHFDRREARHKVCLLHHIFWVLSHTQLPRKQRFQHGRLTQCAQSNLEQQLGRNRPDGRV